MTQIAKWLVLLSLLLSPLAMQPAEAAPGHRAMSASSASHCGDHGQKPKMSMPGECAMGCASALPAFDLLPLASSDMDPVAVSLTRIATLTGLTPEAAIPPPRHG